ncbi:MAG: NAD(P)-binding domain-containing protein, partial [Planctomycetota bacterium]|nr:NAD(P)-binding domain-containing protein [Planctomycetota bacterium]
GIYLVGEVGGTPLIKLGLNQGVDVVDKLHATLPSPDTADADLLDFVIVGAGAAGLGAAMRAHELGRRAVTLESERLAMTVENMYKGKILFAEPETVANKSSLWFEECAREVLLQRWRSQIEATRLDVREHEKVADIRSDGDVFRVESTKGTYRCRRVLMCVGKAGNPRKAGVPGEQEHATRVFHTLSDPQAISGKRIFVYGGGDVAAEATLALCERNDVTMATIDKELIFPKKRNVDALFEKRDAGKLDLHLSSRLQRIEDGRVAFTDATGDERTVENDLVFEMIGAELPIPFFRKVGIALEGDWNAKRWLYLAAVAIGVYTLYALKKFPEMPYAWPFNHVFDEASFFAGLRAVFEFAFLPFRWLFQSDAYATMLETPWFQQGYLYSLAYTIVMGWFGYKALVRWTSIARDPAYQKWRYLSLIFFQVVFFLIANVVAVQALSIQHAWRAWGLYQPWPLFFNTFHWWNESDPRAVLAAFIGTGLIGTFVAIPWASRRHGKRFCTWICGCGGLAETLGDRWRHLSPKGKRSRAWEFQGAVVLVAAAIVTLITVGMFGTRANNGWALAYSYIVDFWLVAVIPIALYPFFGGKIWCRYWCPLAAWNQILSKWYGKLTIKSDDQCISCTMCSRYCQVGVDVMAFAKNQEPFDNTNTSCIHCGICIDVCPMNVLSFDDGRERSMTPAPAKLLEIEG